MNHSRILYHMVRADFLERVRRYSFLLAVAFSIYLGYAVFAGQLTLQLDVYRGVNNSAWVGALVGLVGSVWLSLVGFYIVKNAIQRDRETRVGQILATTPMSKSFYTLSKMLSNFAVLATMAVVLALAAVVIELAQGSGRVDLIALIAPMAVFALAALAVTAALAVLFETLPVLRGGVGNVVYFFVWIFILTIGALALDSTEPGQSMNVFKDYTGLASVMSQMQAQLRSIDPLYKGGASFGVGGLLPTTKTFLWMGLHWNANLLLSRGMFFVIAIALALAAALFFDRFDPAKNGMRAKKQKKVKAIAAGDLAQADAAVAVSHSVAGLTPLVAQRSARPRLFTLAAAELRLMVRGHAWWWYAIAGGLNIACLASPLDAARSGVILAAWLFPVLVWSQMGTREARFSTGSLIFSAPHAALRQLLACYAAGVAVAALTGGGLGLHLGIERDWPGLAAWAAAALFIPAVALVLGVASTSRKPFEALFTAAWYVGPIHHIRRLDFMGTTAASSTPVGYAVAAVALLLVAYAWRKARLARA